MTDGDRCPHCGSEDFDSVGPHFPRVCLTCGYDDEHGASGVCPGGKHPNDADQICCDGCWNRMPRDLPGYPKWRSRLRAALRQTRRGSSSVRAWSDAEGIHKAIRRWLADHPRETRRQDADPLSEESG